MKKANIYAIGVFDLFHRGHISFLKKAKDLGTKLIVAVNSDQITEKYKRSPIYNEEDRLALVSACKFVDRAFVIDTYDNKEQIIINDIDVIVHGDDWDLEGYKDQIRVDDTFLDKYNVELKLLDYTKGVSTSKIIEKVKENY